MRSKFILIAALLMGAITTFLFFQYMKQYDQEALVNDSMVDVVVAVQSIHVNDRMSAGIVKMQKVPAKGLHPNAVRNTNDVSGKFATADMEPGEVILSHHLKSQTEENLFVSRKVKEGYRAVSIGVNFVQSISNLIEPEDTVDVVFSEHFKEANVTRVHTELILSNVRVLAIGRRMIETTGKEEYVEYSSVTLELVPNEAVRLINASERGNIQLALNTRIAAPNKLNGKSTKAPANTGQTKQPTAK